MKGLAYGGKYFDDLGLSCNFPDMLFPGAETRALSIPRFGDPPVMVGTQQSVRMLTFSFLSTTGADPELTRRTLLAALQPGSTEQRVFVAQFNDGTEVEALMTVGQWRPGDVNETYVDFYQADPVWYEREYTILPQVSFTGAIAIPMLNNGGAPVAPIIQVGYSVQRASESPTVGWKYRRTVTVTNNGDRTWHRSRLTFDLGDTAALVSGSKAQADGDDLVVRVEGVQLARTLTNWNTTRSFVHVAATIPAGASVVFEVLYGNPDATVPYTLSQRGGVNDTYAADDLTGYSGTASAGAGSTITATGTPWVADEWNGGFIQILSGTGSGQRRQIEDTTTSVITVSRAWGTNPNGTSVFAVWKSGIAVDGGVASAGGSNSMTDSSQSWVPNQWVGATWVNVSVGSAPATMTVLSNTATVLTFTGSFSVNPGVGDVYYLERYGVLGYNVDLSLVSKPQRGLWRTNPYSSDGTRTRFGDQVPGGWLPWLMVDNQDQFAQLDVTDETAGASVSNWPYLSARRRVRSDLTMPQKGSGDGVCLYEPRGLVAMEWDYRMENDNGIGQVVVMTQESDADSWNTIASDSTTRASFVAVTSGNAAGGWSLVGDDYPVRLYTGVIPAGGITSEIASTESKNRNAEVRNNTKLIVYMAIDDCGGLSSSIWSVSAEAAAYDLNVAGRLGGGDSSDKVQPYYTFAAGGSGHYVHLASGQKLWLNPAPSAEAPLLGIYNSSDVLVSRAPYAAEIARHELNLDGTDTELVDYRLLLPPGTNMVANEDDIANWTISNGAGVTATLINEATEVWDGTNSIEVAFSATPAGAWTSTITYARIPVVPGAHYEFGFLRKKQTLAGTISVQMKIDWEEADGIMSAAEGTTTIGSTTLTTWSPAGSGHTAHAGSAVTNPTIQALIYIVISGSGSTTGSVFLDLITLGVPNLYLDEEEIGTLTVDVKWQEGWIA